MKNYVNAKSMQLTPAGQELAPLFKHIQFIPNTKAKGHAFINEGDVIQTPVKMEYDENFNPKAGKNYFLMHSTPAPNAKKYAVSNPDNYQRYLTDMGNVMELALRAQINSGSKHILWNYF